MAAVVRPRFYWIIACVIVAFAVLGFARSFYLRFLTDLKPISVLLFVHGVIMTVWLAVFVAQVRLVSANRVDLHRKLGPWSASVGAFVVLSGYFVTIAMAGVPRASPGAMTPGQVTIIGFTTITLFAVFFALGLANRRRPMLHKRFMIMAMIAGLTPAITRFLRLVELHEFRAWLVPGIIGAFVAWCLMHDWRQNRVVHPIYLVGGLVVMASWPLRQIAGRSEWYAPIGEAVVRFAQGM